MDGLESMADRVVGSASTQSERLERRLVGRALTHWEAARNTRRLPSLADYEGAAPPYGVAGIYVIRIRENELADEILRAGEAVIEALGHDPIGRKAIEVLPSSTETGMSYWRTAAQMTKPIADVGGFTNSRGIEVRYRSILLPLSDDQIEVDHVLGAFSFKFLR